VPHRDAVPARKVRINSLGGRQAIDKSEVFARLGLYGFGIFQTDLARRGRGDAKKHNVPMPRPGKEELP
jgi:hypothetical protein